MVFGHPLTQLCERLQLSLSCVSQGSSEFVTIKVAGTSLVISLNKVLGWSELHPGLAIRFAYMISMRSCS